MRRFHVSLLVTVLIMALSNLAPGAVFQYSLPVATEKKTDKGTEKTESTAFLWIPPDAKQVRGVILAGMTLMEREFSKDPVIRKAAAEQQLAIIFLKCGLGATNLQTVLDDFAKVSGYNELSVAPLLFIGHSAGGPQAREMAVRYANRCFGLVQYRGGPPWDSPVPANIPALMMTGQFDEFGGMMRNAEGVEHWEKTMAKMGEYRTQDDNHLASMLVEPGAGHFPWSERNAVYLALWLKKAAAAKIPAEWPITAAPPALKNIDPATGWLTTLNLKKTAAPWPAAKGAPVGNWHFDEELAKAAEAYHHPESSASFGLKDQFIKWNDAYWVDAGARYFFNNITWIGDGQTFEVHPVYADAYPKPQPTGGPRWASTGQPAGHSKAPILVKLASGAVVPTGPNTFRFQYDNLSPATEGGRITFMAYSVGDHEYRYTEHVGMLPRNFAGLKDGKEQTITFPPIGDLKADAAPVTLRATSDAEVPVEYYVASGPAIISEGKLKISELPARAAFPIQIKVVAWQFGSGVEPKIKTAKPVEQIIKLEKP